MLEAWGNGLAGAIEPADLQKGFGKAKGGIGMRRCVRIMGGKMRNMSYRERKRGD